MSENTEILQKKLINCKDIAYEAIGSLDKAKMALEELMSSYYWDYEPSARDAVEYGSTLGKENKDDLGEKARWSWEYIEGYKKIMWLVDIAHDYCLLALDSVKACDEV